MAEKNETAEQKLLKIIENPSAAPAAQGAQSAPVAPAAQAGAPAPADAVAAQVASAVKSTGLPSLSLPSVFGPFANLFKDKLPFVSGILSFGPREINKILFLTIGFLTVAFVFNFFGGVRLLGKKITFSVEAKAVPADMNFVPQVKAVSDYLSSVDRRNIFQPYEKKEVDVSQESSAGSTELSVIAKNLKLVGISWSDSAASACAMIEDTRSGITRFVKEGEMMNEVTLKKIYADRVVVSLGAEELTIKL